MRKGFDGLSGLVHSELGRRPVSGEVFIFVNHQRDKIKMLHWEQGGFVLYYKRLERGTLELPIVERSMILTQKIVIYICFYAICPKYNYIYAIKYVFMQNGLK